MEIRHTISVNTAFGEGGGVRIIIIVKQGGCIYIFDVVQVKAHDHLDNLTIGFNDV